MDDDLVQVYARLTAHELFLELIYAQWLATMSDADADKIIAQVLRAQRNMSAPADGKQGIAEAHGLQIVDDARIIGERFFAKVRNRAVEIRRVLSA